MYGEPMLGSGYVIYPGGDPGAFILSATEQHHRLSWEPSFKDVCY